MKRKIPLLIALILATAGVYFARELLINQRAARLSAEIDIQNWAERLMKQGGIGRNCASVNHSDVNAIFESRGQNPLENGTGILDYSGRCWKEMKLSELRYYAAHHVVSGVYRCEKDELIQELQLAIYLEPRSVPQENDCKVGTFPKAWNLPVGGATMFGLP